VTETVATQANTIVDLCRRGISAMLSMQTRSRITLLGVSQAFCKASGHEGRQRSRGHVQPGRRI
jgi:hypothetical protein